MAIKPPAWCAGAIPEMNKGWVDPNTNELLVSSRFTQAQVDEFYGVPSFEDIQDMNQDCKIEAGMAFADKVEPTVVDEDEWQAEDLNQDGVVDELESMTKKELELLGREHGVELDRRKNRKSLVSQMRNLLSK